MRGPAIAFALVVLVQTAPTPSVEARLRLENISLKQQLAFVTAQRAICEGRLAPDAYKASVTMLETDISDIVKTFEAEHPGWTLDAKTGVVTKKGGT